MASVLIAQALQKGPCGANQIAYTDVGSAEKLSEQGLHLRNTANKTLPSWLLPKLTAHALKASSHPDAILFLPSTVCSSRVTTHNSNRLECVWYSICQYVKQVGFENSRERERESIRRIAVCIAVPSLCSRETRPWLKNNIDCCAESFTLQ
jgi:hypothetical protein